VYSIVQIKAGIEGKLEGRIKEESKMPKDPTRNIPNYKIGGDHLNEFEFEQNKGHLTGEEKPPQNKGELNDDRNSEKESQSGNKTPGLSQ
jgi:hypothetical protein